MSDIDEALALQVLSGAESAMDRWKEQSDLVRGIIAVEYMNGVHHASQLLVSCDGGVTAQDLTRGVKSACKKVELVIRRAGVTPAAPTNTQGEA